MKIIYNYDGASIDIVEDDKTNNIIYLSLKNNNKYNHYYNFKIDNSNNKVGTIIIKDFVNSFYYNKKNKYIPYLIKDDKINKFKEDKVKIIDNDYYINIDKDFIGEISLYPRYVKKDLEQFIDTIKENNNIETKTNPLVEIKIGKQRKKNIVIFGRIHPGETLSSYFIEEIIKYILNNENILNNYSFTIYPMISTTGVENGEHRYTSNVDLNRIWNKKNIFQEIDYIKNKLIDINPYLLIDVHGDEITNIDYIKTNMMFLNDNLGSFKVLKDRNIFYRFLRALIKQKKIINIFNMTAREYICKKYNCKGILIELSLEKNDINSTREKAKIFIKKLLEVLNNENNDSCKK